jgi:hypothetical protein
LRLKVNPEAWLDAADANPAFRRCTTDVLTRVVDEFARHAVDYEDAAEELGIKAQFVDINRKIGKLKRWMWQGKPLHGEQPDEVIMDLIAHLLLTLDMMNRDPGLQGVDPAALA